MNDIKKIGCGVAFAATLAVLGGCGGSDDPPPVTAQVPASASASTGGFIDYLMALIASSADSLEPVDISMVSPPADDTGDPAVLN